MEPTSSTSEKEPAKKPTADTNSKYNKQTSQQAAIQNTVQHDKLSKMQQMAISIPNEDEAFPSQFTYLVEKFSKEESLVKKKISKEKPNKKSKEAQSVDVRPSTVSKRTSRKEDIHQSKSSELSNYKSAFTTYNSDNYDNSRSTATSHLTSFEQDTSVVSTVKKADEEPVPDPFPKQTSQQIAIPNIMQYNYRELWGIPQMMNFIVKKYYLPSEADFGNNRTDRREIQLEVARSMDVRLPTVSRCMPWIEIINQLKSTSEASNNEPISMTFDLNNDNSEPIASSHLTLSEIGQDTAVGVSTVEAVKKANKESVPDTPL